MGEMNPIKYADLISPDDSIEKLIGQLEHLKESYTGMADSIKAQAAGVAASLRSVSGATAQGQSATRSATAETDRLAKAYRDLAFARSDTARRIAELKAAQQEENRITKLTIQLNNTEEGSYAHLSAQYALNKMQLNQLTAAEREALPHAKKLEQETKAIYEEMKRLQEATGKYSLNVGNYENAITNAIGVNTRWYNQMMQLSTLFEGGMANGLRVAGEAVAAFGRKLLALLANPIVATIAAITAAFMALSKGITSSEENTMALQRVLAPFQRVLTGVISILQTAAGYVLKLAEGFEMAALMVSRFLERIPGVGKYFKQANDAIQTNIELTKAQQELTKKERANVTERAKLERDAAKARNEAERINDPKKRTALLKQADAAQTKILENELSLAQENLRIKQALAKQAKNDANANNELAQAEARLYKAEEEYYQRTIRIQSKLRTLSGKGGGGVGAGAGATVDDTAKRRLESTRQLEDERIKLIGDQYQRERMQAYVAWQRQKQDLEALAEEEKDIVTKNNILAMIPEIEKAYYEKMADITEKEGQAQAQAEKDYLDRRLKATDELIKKRAEAIRNGEEAIAREYDLSMSYAELEQSENKKTEMRLKAERDRLTKLLRLYEQDGKTLTDVELQTIRNAITAVDEELAKNVGKRDLWDMLGFSLSEEKKEALDTAFSYATEQLTQYIDAWVQAAEQKRQIADSDVERAKSVVDTEIEARNKGYASNVVEAQRELELARNTQRKAIENERKAQRAQAAIQTIEQAGNLVTATTKIWSQLGNPIFSLPAIAIMWGAFAAAKLKAAQMTKGGDERYGEGTVELLQGGSHQSGHDIDLGRKPNGTRRRAEGGEYFAVINKRNSRRFRSLIPSVINSLNDGTFAAKYGRAYDDGGLSVMVNGGGTDISSLSRDVRLIREQGEHERYVDGRGNTVEQYKNLKRTIRPN